MMKRIVTRISFFVFSFFAVAALAASGKAAPDFALKSMDGSNVRLSELRGNVVLVNFWATWCGPCREEMPLLDALHKRYEKLGFTVLGINVEKESKKAGRFLKDTPVTFPILFDAKNEVSKLYDVDAMPSTVIIDRNGVVRHIHRGYLPGYVNDYQTQVRALIRE